MIPADIAGRVDAYERRRARGDVNSALEHEEIHELVSLSLGPVAGAFFDKEHTLPLATAGLPWPMKQHAANRFRLTRLALSGNGFIAALILVPLSSLWSIVIPLAVAGAIYCLVTFIPKLFPPRDLDERVRLVSVRLQLLLTAGATADARRRARQVADNIEFDRITREAFGDNQTGESR